MEISFTRHFPASFFKGNGKSNSNVAVIVMGRWVANPLATVPPTERKNSYITTHLLKIKWVDLFFGLIYRTFILFSNFKNDNQNDYFRSLK